MARPNPFEFVRQVRQEIGRITWPTRRETVATTVMVFVMVFVLSIFFLVVDQVLATAVTWILGIGQ